MELELVGAAEVRRFLECPINPKLLAGSSDLSVPSMFVGLHSPCSFGWVPYQTLGEPECTTGSVHAHGMKLVFQFSINVVNEHVYHHVSVDNALEVTSSE